MLFLLLGHLETWAEEIDDAALAKSLGEFYGFLRLRIIRLQSTGSRAEFERLSSLVLEVRSTWQQKDQQTFQRQDDEAAHLSTYSGERDRIRAVWSA